MSEFEHAILPGNVHILINNNNNHNQTVRVKSNCKSEMEPVHWFHSLFKGEVTG